MVMGCAIVADDDLQERPMKHIIILIALALAAAGTAAVVMSVHPQHAEADCSSSGC
jgi:hypothetical protein